MLSCEECGEEFNHIGRHWVYNKSHYPDLSDEKESILIGILMGDGSLSTQNKTNYMRVVNTNFDYLEYINSKFPKLATGTKLKKSAEQKASADRQNGFNESAVAENYQDLYYVQFRGHPLFNKLENWYSPDKQYPEGLTIDKQIMRHWYVCDGHIRNDRAGQIKISVVNERNSINKLRSIIQDSDFPNFDCVHNYDCEHCSIVWNKESATNLLSMLGEPVPGFEYKWRKV